MGYKNLYKTTTNRGEFNRAYKYHLEHTGKIRCSYCRFHHSENRTNKYYGEYGSNGMLHPNWKLVSKLPKQWMKKPIKYKIEVYGGNKYEHIDITW